MKIHVNVTQEDIEKGDNDCRSCPIARAILRGYDDVGMVSVQPIGRPSVEQFRAFWEVGDTLYRADLPNEARKFIKNFDAGMPVTPFHFELEGVARE
jgi:hypothetical protein